MRSEASIQASVVQYARAQGWIAIKLSGFAGYGTQGWPDYVFFKNGRAFFIEFKQPGKEPTPLQYKRIEALQNADFVVEVIDDVTEGKDLVDREA